MSASLDWIKKAQVDWAHRTGRASSRPEYATTLNDNLFRALSPDTEAEFRDGDGSELDDTAARPAKMRSFLSSSALAVNFFEAWRGAQLPNLLIPLGVEAAAATLRFEYKPAGYPVGPNRPNLDLLLSLMGGVRVAIESKFAEPFRPGGSHGMLSSKYFPPGTALWEAAGLRRAQVLAESLAVEWHHLDPSQLLKHMLGIACERGGPATLVYLWYDTGLPDAAVHRLEVSRFADLVAGDVVAFKATSYQELFAAIPIGDEPHPGWHDYMKARYFSTPAAAPPGTAPSL